MIKRLTLQNFRSFKLASVELRPFNCLVGPNNSGKSNLVSALKLVEQAWRSTFVEAIKLTGAEKEVHYGAPPREPAIVEFTLEPSPVPGSESLQYTLGISRSHPYLEREVLNLHAGTNKTETALSVTPNIEGQSWTVRLPNQSVNIGWGSDGWIRSQSDPTIVGFKEQILKWRFYKFAPDRLKQAGPAAHAERLASDGSNLA